MDAQYKRHANIGPGGMKCPCCAPAPGKDRATAKRHWKRSERQNWQAEAELEAVRASLLDGDIYGYDEPEIYEGPEYEPIWSDDGVRDAQLES